MQNKEIIKILKLHSQLLELHNENIFKIRSYTNAATNIENYPKELAQLSLKELESVEGIGKAISQKIQELIKTGSFKQFDEYLAKTPKGIIEMFLISGLGVKKIQKIWQELRIEDTDQLLQACENNQIANAKGFGLKTQENIKKGLLLFKESIQKMRMDKAEAYQKLLQDFFREHFPEIIYEFTGEIRQHYPIVSKLQITVASESAVQIFEKLNKSEFLEKDEQSSGLFAWRGKFTDTEYKVEIIITSQDKFWGEVFINSSNLLHLNIQSNQKTLLEIAYTGTFESEQEIYKEAGLPFIIAPMREGMQEIEWSKKYKSEDIVQEKDIKGILHAHSTYSDGKNTLEEMAIATQKLGYQYLGITDHSKSAFYANGLYEQKIIQQHSEIDKINQKLAPFHIFKGIESDILQDGSLDYDVDVLKTFDFIIASVHSGLGMDEEKSTKRLIKAIENPHTTMLGHPTGRLLLRREAYPINHKKIIDACANNDVSIEINANPWRLDIDWKWLYYAMEKEVWISINPDAHSIESIKDVKFGVKTAQKAGLPKIILLNIKAVEDIRKYFQKKF